MFRVLDAYGRVRNSVITSDGPQGPTGAAGADGTAGRDGYVGPHGRHGLYVPRHHGLSQLVHLDRDVEGNLPVTRLDSGSNADEFSVWGGDGAWHDIGDGNGSGQPQVFFGPDNSTATNVGNIVLTGSAAATVVTDSAGQWGRITSSADNVIQQVRNTFGMCRASHNPIFMSHVRTGSVITNLRLWIGLTSAAFTNVDTHAGNCIAFRYSTVAGDAGWMGVTRDGTTQSVTASQVANIALSTVYKLKITVTGGGTLVTFDVNGSTATLSANIPGATDLLMACAVVRVSTANKVIDYRYVKCWR